MKKFFSVLMTAILAAGMAWSAEVSDTLTYTLIGVTGTSYTTWSSTTANSDAVYAGKTAGGKNSIQLRSNNSDCGIITTASGGKLKSVSFKSNDNSDNARTISVYGKSSAYSSAADVFDASTRGTLIGEAALAIGGTGTVTVAEGDEYEYFGIRSKSGAAYLDYVIVTWEVEGDEPVSEEFTLAITPAAGTYNAPQQVTISTYNAEGEVAVYYTLDGTDPSESNTAVEYTEPFTLYESATVKAYAFDSEMNEASAEAAYTINLPAIAATFTPAAGTYTTAQNVTVELQNLYGESIVAYYVNNEEVQYDNGIALTESGTYVVRVEAMDEYHAQPAEFTAQYVLNLPEPMPASGVATIVFDDNESDSSTAFTAATLMEYITTGANYVASTTTSKTYPGTTGVKFSSSSMDGYMTLTFASPFPNVKSVVVNAKAYNSTQTSKINAGDGYSDALTTEYADYTVLGEQENDLASLTLQAQNRLYLKSITITWGDQEEPFVPETVTVTGTITDAENAPIQGATVTITVVVPEQEEPAGMRRAGSETSYTGTTDANGQYSIDVTTAENATYNMTVAKEGYETQTLEGINLENPGNVTLQESIITAISDLNAAQNVTYVNVMGQTSNRPFNGVNIVLSNGKAIGKLVK
ncbi:MAG: chitobiase/beta-hexosaminidase C-terminal domain-containing protein [Muribaculaceae bacterium]|nr:chitobiase/beta-hexosaminidase C-terminal domain-containing protein [Muribaculaceae bacterium]